MDEPQPELVAPLIYDDLTADWDNWYAARLASEAILTGPATDEADPVIGQVAQ